MATTTFGGNALRVLVAGGSLGGLAAGLALLRIGCNVEVFEKSSARIEERGAGLVVQPETLQFMENYTGTHRGAFSVRSKERHYLARDGTPQRAMKSRQLMTSWNALYGLMKEAFPAGRYHRGREAIGFEQDEEGVTVHFAGGDKKRADLLVAADGTGSTCRAQLLPAAQPQYAGYVAWRGTVNEADAEAGLKDMFLNRFIFHQGKATQILCYTIPGPEGEVEEGRRRLNWVWYWNTPEGEPLRKVMTGLGARQWAHSVPQGQVRPELFERQKEHARQKLPGIFQRLIEATEEPFIQPIVDLGVDRMVFGRVALIGDAAFTPRPHTAASTSKAIINATSLALMLDKHPGDRCGALARWEKAQLRLGDQLHSHGRRLGAQSCLGHAAFKWR